MRSLPGLACCGLLLFLAAPTLVRGQSAAGLQRSDLFPFQPQHVHGSTLVALEDGSVLAAWFQGSGERWADDVAIMGARLQPGADEWSEPFVMADVPGFPDTNPVLFVDPQDRLWLAWSTVMANQWETALLEYRISEEYLGDGPPDWDWQSVLHMKPGDPAERGILPGDRFVTAVEAKLADYQSYLEDGGMLAKPEAQARWEAFERRTMVHARGEDMARDGRVYREDGSYAEQELGYPYFRRMGWMTRNKPLFLESGRIILPLYSDGFDFSLMAITDDGGQTWAFSEPLVAPGNIQPAMAQRADGSIVAYMRDNGPAPKRLHVSTSTDGGLTWSPVRDTAFPNPGSAADVTVLPNGHWVIVYNDSEEGRHSLAVSISADEGRTWPWTRHLEQPAPGDGDARSHYPAVVADADGTLHVVYSYHREGASGDEKTIRYARFDEEWVRQGDG